MKRLLGMILFFGFLVAGCPDAPPAPNQTVHLSSRVELAAGEVWLHNGKNKQRMITGALVPEGATVRAQKGSRALIRLNNGAGIFLRGGTDVHISNGNVRIEKGELWADIPDDENKLADFEVGDVKVSASGAGFNILKTDNEVQVYVARGLAVVEAPGGRVEVSSGEQAKVVGKKPKLSPVSFFDDWTGGMADRPMKAGIGGSASGKIYGIDRAQPGTAPKELQIVAQNVNTMIREGVAYTVVDQTFFNTASSPVEGWYWFTVPEGASVVRFAWEVNGAMVEGGVVERKQAAASYEAAVERAMDPALLEWIDGRTYRARIFPVPATGAKRIILGYTELLPLSDGVYRYLYPMAGEDAVMIQEFSLQVDLGPGSKHFDISTLQDARVEADKRLVSMRRSGFTPHSDFLLELKPTKEQDPIRVMRYGSGKNEADYVMVRYSPAVDWSAVTDVPGDVVVVLDTSAGGDDSAFQIRTQTAEAILRSLSDGDRFAVMSTDLTPQVLYPAKGLSAASSKNISVAVEKMAQVQPAGATDLGKMFSTALALVHDAPQPAIVYIGDGVATSGETSSDALAERLRRAMGNSRARLFTISVGANADYSLLSRLSKVGGGEMFRIDVPAQIVQESLRFTGRLKTPTITELQVDLGAGMDQLYSNRQGKISKGEEVVILARTHHQMPHKINIKGSLAGKEILEKYDVKTETGSEYAYIPSLWARMYLERLMGRGVLENRGKIISLGLSYGLMTPFTSFLVLEASQANSLPAYQSPFRQWSLNSHPEKRTVKPKDALSIPLFGFGCAEYDSKSSEPLVSDEKEVPQAPAPGVNKSEASAIQPSSSGGLIAPIEQAAIQESPASLRNEPMMKSVGSRLRAVSGRGENKKGKKDKLMGADDAMSTAGGLGTQYGKQLMKDEAPAPMQIATQPKVRKFDMSVCSDAATRPLSERRVLWARRFSRAKSAADMLQIFVEAGQRCELPTYRHRKVLLDIISNRVHTAVEVESLLVAFGLYPAARNHLRRNISRRFLDPDSTMGLYFDSQTNWFAVKTGLAALASAEKRLVELRKILEKHSDSVAGRTILVQVLMENKLYGEAMREARRLHAEGAATPDVLVVLCDLEAQNGNDLSARRMCSELVEFNFDSAHARRKLGDLFLRHGWYADAYRQYATLVEGSPEDMVAKLRLSIAAAGMGKIDESLRIARNVAVSDGEPGSDDPRRWAALLSIVRLSRMMADAQTNKEDNKSLQAALERQLRRTGLFSSQKTMELVIWEDLEIPFQLAVKNSEGALPLDSWVDGKAVGIAMVDLGSRSHSDMKPYELELSMSASLQFTQTVQQRNIPVSRIRIEFDGKRFHFSFADAGTADLQQGIVRFPAM